MRIKGAVTSSVEGGVMSGALLSGTASLTLSLSIFHSHTHTHALLPSPFLCLSHICTRCLPPPYPFPLVRARSLSVALSLTLTVCLFLSVSISLSLPPSLPSLSLPPSFSDALRHGLPGTGIEDFLDFDGICGRLTRCAKNLQKWLHRRQLSYHSDSPTPGPDPA